MWEDWYDRHYYALRSNSLRSWAPPEPLSSEEIRRLAWTFLNGPRQLLRELLLDLLADDIADIALAATEEARQ